MQRARDASMPAGTAGPARSAPLPAGPGAPASRRSGQITWLAVFVVVVVTLLIRNRALFSTTLFEAGDSAANSLLVEQARHGLLLHGNYSRQGFYHPGPGYLYVLLAGEVVFHDLLHIVPTWWNGQLIAAYLLDGATIATCVWTIGTWVRSRWQAMAAAAVVIAFIAAHPQILSNNWMPYLYVPTFMLLLVTAASVAAGKATHLPLLVASGCLLIHGQASFLLFVPVTWITVALAYRPWRDGWLRGCTRGIRRFFDSPARWLPPAGIVVVFAIPIVVALATQWPGQFGGYLSYGDSTRAGAGHTIFQSIAYVAGYWGGGAFAWIDPPVLAGLAVVAIGGMRDRQLRRSCTASLWLGLVTTVLALFYAQRGIDNVTAPGNDYMEFFYWAVPMMTLVVIGLGLADRLATTGLLRPLAATGVIAAGVAFAAAPTTRADLHDNVPALKPLVATLDTRSGGRTIVLHDAAPAGDPMDAAGIVLLAQRRGHRACVDDRTWRIQLTQRSMCTAGDRANGVVFQLRHARPETRAGDVLEGRVVIQVVGQTAVTG